MSEAQLLAMIRRYPQPRALARRVRPDVLFIGLRRLERRGLVTRRAGLYRLTARGTSEYAMARALARLVRRS
jgi:Mn-dependent DtxR family transcriptional regulator